MMATLLPGFVRAQSVETMLDESFHAMYNLQFDDALSKAEKAKLADKNDPMAWVTQASAILFREFDRLHILRSETFSSDDAFDRRPAITAFRKRVHAGRVTCLDIGNAG